MEWWARRYVGLPFASGGRSRAEGLDCWGLARVVLFEVFGKVLPSLAERYDSCGDRDVVASLIDVERPLLRARRVDPGDAVPGDLVLLRLAGVPCHIGVYAGDGCMLHVRRGCDAVVEELSRPAWARRIEGYYRV